MSGSTNWNSLVLSGPSGVGKGTLTGQLFKRFPDVFEKPVTFTTRQPRNGEQEGREYYFITKDRFLNMKANNEFLETVEFNGNYYGSTIEKVEKILETGKVCLLQIHIDSGIQLREKNIDCHYVYLQPPSFQELKVRLSQRQVKSKESEEEIMNRLKEAEKEIKKANETKFYTKITNDVIDETIQSIKKLLNLKQQSIQ